MTTREPDSGTQGQERPPSSLRPQPAGEPGIPVLADLLRDWLAANTAPGTEATQ